MHNVGVVVVVTAGGYVVRSRGTVLVSFSTKKNTIEDAIGSHTCSLETSKQLQASRCGNQCHSSRVFTPLTGSHCKLGANT
jgi:hypothetical protein